MTDLLIKILNLPMIAQRAIAVAIAMSGILLAVWAAGGLFAVLEQQAAEILEKRQSLARLEQIITRGTEKAIEPETVNSPAEFLVGDTEAVVQAGLQTKLNAIATSAGATVLSAGGLKALEENGTKYVGLQAILQGKLPAIHQTLLALETARPYLIVRDLTIRSTNGNPNGSAIAPVELSVQLSFIGATGSVQQSAPQARRP